MDRRELPDSRAHPADVRNTICPVPSRKALDADGLKQMMLVFGELIRAHRDHLDRVNVYPVPDGDTGTNLSHTIEGVVQSLDATDDMKDVARAIQRGTLAGARGASGVIMSQLLAAFADRLARVDVGDGSDLADALAAASRAADQAVLHPVEGTILTVAREAARAAGRAAERTTDTLRVLEAARDAAGDALARTPDLLPALRRARVVDAGGTAFVLMLDALLNVLAGRPLPAPPEPPERVEVPSVGVGSPRYEVVVRLAASPAALRRLRQDWERIGSESAVVVEDDELAVAHVHTDHPEAAEEAARSAGEVLSVQVTDLHAQVEERRANDR